MKKDIDKWVESLSDIELIDYNSYATKDLINSYIIEEKFEDGEMEIWLAKDYNTIFCNRTIDGEKSFLTFNTNLISNEIEKRKIK